MNLCFVGMCLGACTQNTSKQKKRLMKISRWSNNFGGLKRIRRSSRRLVLARIPYWRRSDDRALNTSISSQPQAQKVSNRKNKFDREPSARGFVGMCLGACTQNTSKQKKRLIKISRWSNNFGGLKRIRRSSRRLVLARIPYWRRSDDRALNTSISSQPQAQKVSNLKNKFDREPSARGFVGMCLGACTQNTSKQKKRLIKISRWSNNFRGLKRIRTAVDGFADRWLSHSPIRPVYLKNSSTKALKPSISLFRSANIQTFI